MKKGPSLPKYSGLMIPLDAESLPEVVSVHPPHQFLVKIMLMKRVVHCGHYILLG